MPTRHLSRPVRATSPSAVIDSTMTSTVRAWASIGAARPATSRSTCPWCRRLRARDGRRRRRRSRWDRQELHAAVQAREPPLVLVFDPRVAVQLGTTMPRRCRPGRTSSVMSYAEARRLSLPSRRITVDPHDRQRVCRPDADPCADPAMSSRRRTSAGTRRWGCRRPHRALELQGHPHVEVDRAVTASPGRLQHPRPGHVDRGPTRRSVRRRPPVRRRRGEGRRCARAHRPSSERTHGDGPPARADATSEYGAEPGRHRHPSDPRDPGRRRPPRQRKHERVRSRRALRRRAPPEAPELCVRAADLRRLGSQFASSPSGGPPPAARRPAPRGRAADPAVPRRRRSRRRIHGPAPASPLGKRTVTSSSPRPDTTSCWPAAGGEPSATSSNPDGASTPAISAPDTVVTPPR